MKGSIQLIILLFTLSSVYGQELIRGHVKAIDDNGNPIQLPGANVYWSGRQSATITNEKGWFEITAIDLPDNLIISFIGYKTDTLLVKDFSEKEITLKPNNKLNEAVVQSKQDALMISTTKPLNTTTITQKELLKAACCNLSESFETNPSVNVNYTDAITGVKEIQMLGLQGIYTQMLTENLPSLRGLSAPYGLTFIPGPWMHSIQIAKGAGSVVNGFESLTGSINVEFKKPESIDHRYHINLYAGDAGRFESNLYGAKKINEHWSSLLFLHGSMNQTKNDHNDDGFLDQPLYKQINAYSRWLYQSGKRTEGQFGVKFISEQRDGGQTAFNKSEDYGTINHYGMQVKTNRLELCSKTGIINYDKPAKSMGLQTDWIFHDQQSFIGLRNYNATQKTGYINYIFQNEINSCKHKFKAGTSVIIDNYDENYNDADSTIFIRNETYIVTGMFGEYTFEPDDVFTLITGIRFDYSNIDGFFFTPRLHAKLNITPDLAIRISGGLSHRTANIISENFGQLASSRVLVIEPDLKMERGFNYGTNVTYRFKLNTRQAVLSFDLYRTDFINQVIVDAVSNDSLLQFYNLTGQSYAQSAALSFDYELLQNLSLRIAYKFDDVNVTYRKGLQQKPLVARHKALFNVGYEFGNAKWRGDFTTQWTGSKRLNYQHHAEANNNYSPDFFTLNLQITKVFRKFELYAGGENLTNYTQHDPIINPQNPFDRSFDATQIWGPVMGFRFYAGFRMNIK